MSDLREILIEEYNKTLKEVIDPTSLLEMIEEAMDAIGNFSSTGYVLAEAEEKDPGLVSLHDYRSVKVKNPPLS